MILLDPSDCSYTNNINIKNLKVVIPWIIWIDLNFQHKIVSTFLFTCLCIIYRGSIPSTDIAYIWVHSLRGYITHGSVLQTPSIRTRLKSRFFSGLVKSKMGDFIKVVAITNPVSMIIRPVARKGTLY